MFCSFVKKHACDIRTDRQTNRQNYDPKTALAYSCFCSGRFPMLLSIVYLTVFEKFDLGLKKLLGTA